MNACDEIISLTQDLIRIPSMHSRPEEIMRCADFVVQWCGRQGITARKIVHDGTPSVLVMPGDHARLLLMTHVDVVDAPDGLFAPRIEGDRLLGRGAIDDKYAVALSLVLFHDRLRALERNGRTQADMALGLLITGDEETGGENGAARALEGIGADFAIALDGGGPERIVTREKGVIDILLTATGKAAHGARPWLGRNAIDMLLEDYARIRELFEGDDDGDHWHRTVNFGKIRAGESINQVPHTARGWFNIRFTEDDDPQRLVEAIAERVRSRVEVLSTIPVFASPPSPMTDILLDIAPGAVLTREHGASDARHLMDHGIPGAIWGAEGFGTQHGLEECVSIPSIEKLHDRLSTLCERLESDGGR
ncbi:MAG TPA: peptidase M20 [Desulfomicrobium sp.]|nr:peptidase M20 [Desulfomicrobium sp.]